MSRASAALGVAVFVLAFLAHNHFPNDQFVHLSPALQMLAGEWPTRDFADPGMPLMYAVSAAAQWLGNRTLLAEAILVYGVLAAGAAALASAVGRATGSTLLGLWAGLCAFLIGPRTYAYPKVVLYAAAVYCFVRGSRTRSPHLPIALGVLSALAFLFRHDHGLFIGLASAVFLAIRTEDGRDRVADLVRFAAIALLLVLPYVAYIQLNGGVDAYVRASVEFARLEAARTDLKSWTPSVLSGDMRASSAAALFYAFWTLPVVTAVVAWDPQRPKTQAAAAVALSGLGLMANAGFLRDRLEDRIADAAVPAIALAAWLTAALVDIPSPPTRAFRRAAAASGLLAFLAACAIVGQVPQRIVRNGFADGPLPPLSRLMQVIEELRAARAAPQMPSAIALALMPFFEYADACTRPNDAIFVPGFAPEVPYFTRRRFAGGHVTLAGEYFSSESEQRRTVAILRRQSVPLVVLPPESESVLQRHHPLVAEWLRQYHRIAAYHDHQERVTEVWIRAGLPTRGIHEPSGLPCLR